MWYSPLRAWWISSVRMGSRRISRARRGQLEAVQGDAETVAFFQAFEPPSGVEIVVCPPFTSLPAAVGRGIPVYAQNVHWAAEGAFTGEVSAAMLLELGVEGAIVGHSERRQYFGETDETVRLRCEAALEAGSP